MLVLEPASVPRPMQLVMPMPMSVHESGPTRPPKRCKYAIRTDACIQMALGTGRALTRGKKENVYARDWA
eukprot:27142-Lingulodinium_polyedra.AAC.1